MVTSDNLVLQEVHCFLAKIRGTTKRVVEKSRAERTAPKRTPLIAEVANADVPRFAFKHRSCDVDSALWTEARPPKPSAH